MQIVLEPQHYGFHATLRPPFQPTENADREAISGLVSTLAASLTPVTIPSLVLRRISRCFALVPAEPHSGLNTLAAACVRTFEPMRKPLDKGEFTRRRHSNLTDRQLRLLARWGYPYVMEEYLFHLTLTGPINGEDVSVARQALESHFAPLLQRSMRIDALSLVYQPNRDANFRRIGLFPLNGHTPVILPSSENVTTIA